MKRKTILPGWSLVFLWPGLTQADVTFDNSSVVPAASGMQGQTITGAMSIPASYGTQSGSNLFHSFSQFNINTGQSATFTAAGASGAISNVIGRVTGGSSSTIDGALSSTIPGANLYLVNPSGILFGPDASIDVNGAFFASTADYVSSGSSNKFYADTHQSSVLASVAPQAFGFLDNPADLVLSGSRILLDVTEGRSAHFSGGNLRAVDAGIFTLGGNIELAAVGRDGGEIAPGQSMAASGALTASGSQFLALSSAQDSGAIHLAGGDISLWDGTYVTVNSQATGLLPNPTDAGDVTVEAVRLILDNSHITSATNNSADGGRSLVTANDVDLRNGSTLSATASAEGDAGNIVVRTGRLLVQGNGADDSSRITATTLGSGGAGNVTIAGRDGASAREVTIRGGGRIASSTQGSGNGGSVSISADLLTLDNQSSIRALSGAGAPAGTVTIIGVQADILNGSEITVASQFGDAGNIFMYLSRWLYMLDSQVTTSAAQGLGNGGNILIDPQFVILNNSQIIANARRGSGGDINIITRFFLASTNSIVSASSQFGLQGTVSIQSAQSNIAGGISILPGVFMDASGLIQEGCGNRSGQSGGTFTSSSMQGLALSSPDNALDYVPASLGGCSLAL